jgi:hypothetical protein
MPSVDSHAEQERCDDLEELMAERPHRFHVPIRPVLPYSDELEVCLNAVCEQLATAERDIQRLTDYALERDDEVERRVNTWVGLFDDQTKLTRSIIDERNSARRWAKAWKRAACAMRSLTRWRWYLPGSRLAAIKRRDHALRDYQRRAARSADHAK